VESGTHFKKRGETKKTGKLKQAKMKKLLLMASFLWGSILVMGQNPADRDISFNVSGLGVTVFGTGGAQFSKVTSLDGGKVLVTGYFYALATQSPQYSSIVRLNNDGSFDNTFNAGGEGAWGIVSATAVQPDGKIIIGGGFLTYNGTSVRGIARINSDGSLDNTFNSGTGFASILPPPWVRSIAVQTDGKIIIGGGFTSFNGTTIWGVCRLNSDGSLDNTFNPGSGPNNIVEAVAIQPDGKILAGGVFSTFNGVSKGRLVRLNTDGSLDNTFSTGTSGDILRIVLQPDGKILTSGAGFYRLNSDGSLDANFSKATAGNPFMGLALQPDGKIIVSGEFKNYLSTPRQRIVRLNTDGTVDMVFDSELGFSTNPKHLAIQSDGKIVVFDGLEYKGVKNMATRIMGTPVPLTVAKLHLNNIEISIFPNPTSQNITVTIDDAHFANGMNLNIINSYGKLVKQVSIAHSQMTVDLEQLPTGMYYYQIGYNSKIVKTGKLVKI
jgi:uncharacterized delta-60 repeat protein